MPKDPSTELSKIAERLKYQDEDWKTRDEKLQRLRTLITNGALASDGFRSSHASNLKDLIHSVVCQLYDLRSVIARAAVTTLGLLMAEVGDHADAELPLREDALEGLLQLASSGNKVLAAAGRDGFPQLIEHVRFESIIKDGLLVWLRGNKNPAAKTTCLTALLQALQTWPLSLLTPCNESVEVALVEAAAHSNSEIRSLARQCLLQHLQNSPKRQAEVDKYLAKYPDTKKQLDKEQAKPGALSAEERTPPAIRRGESGAANRNGKLGGDSPPIDLSDSVDGKGSMKREASRKAVSKKGGAGSVESIRAQLDANLRQQEKLRADEVVLREKLTAAEEAAAAAAVTAAANETPTKPSFVKSLSAKLLGGGEKPAAAKPAPTAMERMKELRDRRAEMSNEEYEGERQRILQQV